MDFKSKIILISGPTASGKSNFAVKVAKKSLELSIEADNKDYIKMNNDSISEWTNKL